MQERLTKYGLERDDGPPPDDEHFAETKLTLKFRQGLWDKYGLKEKDLHDWQYAGGEWNKNQPWHLAFKEKFEINCEWPAPVDRCVCDVEIKFLCYIANRKRDVVIITGRCCIDKFLGPNRRRCEICNEPHRNRKHNMCTECRKLSNCKKCKEFLERNEPYRKEQLCTECKIEENFAERERVEYECWKAEQDAKMATIRAKMTAVEAERVKRLAPKIHYKLCAICKKERHNATYAMCYTCKYGK